MHTKPWKWGDSGLETNVPFTDKYGACGARIDRDKFALSCESNNRVFWNMSLIFYFTSFTRAHLLIIWALIIRLDSISSILIFKPIDIINKYNLRRLLAQARCVIMSPVAVITYHIRKVVDHAGSLNSDKDKFT